MYHSECETPCLHTNEQLARLAFFAWSERLNRPFYVFWKWLDLEKYLDYTFLI